MQSSDVHIDRGRNKGMLIYFAVLGIAGVVLIVLTVMKDWGFWGWFGAVLLLFTSLASVGSMAKTGGAGLAPCPRCGHANPVLHVTMHRYLCCAGCQTWLEGSTTTREVADDHVASYPVFDADLPEPIIWPDGCPVCGGPVTRTREIEGTSALGDVVGMIAPVSIQKVLKLQVPACEQHDDGVGLCHEGGNGIISFRSMSYWKRFMAANSLQPRKRSTGPS
jgi:endogenous inhibitor of DNA gyrase (YacG/DUF329 family)